MGDRRVVRVDVVVDGVRDCGGSLEYGLQLGKADLDPGTRQRGGAIRYSTEIMVGRREDGTAIYSGDAVNGPSRERFLYVSFRESGAGAVWTRRFKIRLPDRLVESTSALHAQVSDAGNPRPVFHGEGWAES